MGNRTRPIHYPGAGLEEANEFRLNVDIADLSAEASYFAVVDVPCELVKLSSVIDGAVATADVTITSKIGGVAITNGLVTIATAGSAAGDVDSATPSGLNVLSAGQAVELLVSGGGAGGSPRGHVTLTFKRIGKASS